MLTYTHEQARLVPKLEILKSVVSSVISPESTVNIYRFKVRLVLMPP